MEKKNLNSKNDKNSSESNTEKDKFLENDKFCHLYCIFTIDKKNYYEKEIQLQISKNDVLQQFTELIKSEKKIIPETKIEIIQQLYCISFSPKNINSSKIDIHLFLKIKNDSNWISSNKLSIKNKEFIFLYEYSLEELNRNHNGKLQRFKIFQNNPEIFLKFITFYMKLKPNNWDNKSLSLSFIEDTFSFIQKKGHYLIILILLEMSYGKCDSFYSILKYFYTKQKDIYYPPSLEFKKYKKFFEKIDDENKLFFDNINPGMEKENIILYFDALKETSYRKYDKDNYLKLAKEKKFLEIIKRQITNREINKQDKINEEIILEILAITKTSNEVESTLKLCDNLFIILKYILFNFDHIANIYFEKHLFIKDMIDKVENNSLEKVKEMHMLLLIKEQEQGNYFINFIGLFNKYISFFVNNNLDNLVFIKEMINNQKQYGQELEGMENNINNAIHQTGIYLTKNEKLNSKEIISFILDIDEIHFYTKIDIDFFKSINIYKFDEIDYKNFKKVWFKIDKNNHDKLFEIIFSKIGVMKDIGLIFELIPISIFDAEKAQLL